MYIYFFVTSRHLATSKVYLKLIPSMALVLHKNFNCAVNKTTNTGHTTNINYTLILMMILIGHGPSL